MKQYERHKIQVEEEKNLERNIDEKVIKKNCIGNKIINRINTINIVTYWDLNKMIVFSNKKKYMYTTINNKKYNTQKYILKEIVNNPNDMPQLNA